MTRATVALIGVSVGLPLLALLVWSFTFRWNFPNILPSEWGVEAWSYTLSRSSKVFEGLSNSLAIGVLVTALAILIGLPASRALGLSSF